MKTKVYGSLFVIASILAIWFGISASNHYSFAKEAYLESESKDVIIQELEAALGNEQRDDDLMDVFKQERLSKKERLKEIRVEEKDLAEWVERNEMQIRCQRLVLTKESDMNCLIEENYTQFAK